MSVISHVGVGDLSTSLTRSEHGRGHVTRIGSRPGDEFARPVFAAGALLWRHAASSSSSDAAANRSAATPAAESGEVEVAVIHRPRYDDWSLPKGKVDPGENLAGTAVREIKEETGFDATLGWLLGFVHYPVGSRTKVVYYWTAQVTGGEFVANEESDELRWVSPDEARELLSYEADQEILSAGLEMLGLGCDRRVLLVRHAKAHKREGWAGDDNLRPLSKKGRRQAEFLVPQLGAYSPQAVSSALPVRCRDTVAALAEGLGLEVAVQEDLGDVGFDRSPDIALRAFRRAGALAPVSVVVSQGEAIPGVLRHAAGRNGFVIDDLKAKKASVWVLHFRGEELLGADYLASPAPLK